MRIDTVHAGETIRARPTPTSIKAVAMNSGRFFIDHINEIRWRNQNAATAPIA